MYINNINGISYIILTAEICLSVIYYCTLYFVLNIFANFWVSTANATYDVANLRKRPKRCLGVLYKVVRMTKMTTFLTSSKIKFFITI